MTAVAAPGQERRAVVEHVMGLPVSVHLRGPGARSRDHLPAVARLFAALRDVDAVFSTYRADSDVSRLDRGEIGVDDTDPRVREVLRRCEGWRLETGGSFDVGASGSLDPSGLVKGWAVEGACRGLDADLGGALDWCVNAGGDVLVSARPGRPAWRVGVEDPADRRGLLDVVELAAGAVATSGTAARGEHVLDPRTGRPARGLAAVTVVAASLEVADVLATAAFARGRGAAAWLAGWAGVHWAVVTTGGAVTVDAGWPGSGARRPAAAHGGGALHP